MRLKKAFFRILHPNKAKRPYEQAAQAQINVVNSQAAVEREAAHKRKEDNLSAVTAIYNQAREEYDLEYSNELSQITTQHDQKHTEYLELLNNLQQSKQRHNLQRVCNKIRRKTKA